MGPQSTPDDDWLDDVILLPLPPEMQDGYMPSTHVDFSQEDRAMVGYRPPRKSHRPVEPPVEDQEVLVPDDEHDKDEAASPPLPTTPMDDDADEVMISTVDEGFPHARVPTPLTPAWRTRDDGDASVIGGSSSEQSRPVKSDSTASPVKSDTSLRELLCSPFFVTSAAVKVAEQDAAKSPTRTAPSGSAEMTPIAPPLPQFRSKLVEYEDSEAGEGEETAQVQSPPSLQKNGLELLKDLYDSSSPVATPAKTSQHLPADVSTAVAAQDAESAVVPTTAFETPVEQTPDVCHPKTSSPLPVPPSPPPTPSTVPENDALLIASSTSDLPKSHNSSAAPEKCVTSPPPGMSSLKAPSSTTPCDPLTPLVKPSTHDAEDKENVAGLSKPSNDVPLRFKPARDSAVQPLAESTGANVKRTSPPARNALGIADTLRMLSDSYAQDDRTEEMAANRGLAWDVSDPKNPRPIDRAPSLSSSRGTPVRSVQAPARVPDPTAAPATPSSTPQTQTVPAPQAAKPSSSTTTSLRAQSMTTTPAPTTTSSRTFKSTGWVKTAPRSQTQSSSTSTTSSGPSLSLGQPIPLGSATTRPRLIIQLSSWASALVPSILGGSTPSLTPNMPVASAVDAPQQPSDQTPPAAAAAVRAAWGAEGVVAVETSAEPTTETIAKPIIEAETEPTAEAEAESTARDTAQSSTETKTELTEKATKEDTTEPAVHAGNEVMAEVDGEVVAESETTTGATATAEAEAEDVVMAESEAGVTAEAAADTAAGIQSDDTAGAVLQENETAVGDTEADSTPPSSVPSSSSKTTASRIGRHELDGLLSLPSKWGPRSPRASRRRKPSFDPGQSSLPPAPSATSSTSVQSSSKRTRSRTATLTSGSATDQTKGSASPPAKRRKAFHTDKSHGRQAAGLSEVSATPTATPASSFQSVVSGSGGLKRSERVKGRKIANVMSPTDRGQDQNMSISPGPSPSSEVPLRRDTAVHVPWSEIENAMVVTFFKKRKINKANAVICWEKLKAEIVGFERTQKAVEVRARALQREGRIPHLR